jgi:proteasome accessory factor B
MERLLNVVVALLGTKKFLTKAQITSAVPGYEGTNEARDRMFERDKDDLRKIGIEIEVKQLDPLFDDEVGYRIRRDDYRIQIPDLTAEEGMLAAAALTLISTLRATDDLRAAHLKLGSLIPVAPSPMERIITSMNEGQVVRAPAFAQLLPAIRERLTVHFDYIRDSDSLRSRRHVEPLRLLLRDQEWLLEAWDREKSAIRYFLVENIVGDVGLGEGFDEREIEGASPRAINEKAMKTIEVLSHPELDPLLISEGGELLSSNGEKSKFVFRTYNPDRLYRTLLSIDTGLELAPAEAMSEYTALRRRFLDAI